MKKVDFNLDDLRVESFETLPELSDKEVEMVGGAAPEASFYLCGGGCETVVCCYPTCGCGSG